MDHIPLYIDGANLYHSRWNLFRGITHWNNITPKVTKSQKIKKKVRGYYMPDLYGVYDNKVCTPKVTLRVKNIKIRVIQMLLHVWLITYTVNKVCQILIKKKK